MSRPDFFKESDILSNMGSNVKSTSAGPTDRVRMKQLASTYSKNSFIIEIKGVAVNSLMSDLEICVPIKVRFRQHDTQGLIVNAYSGYTNQGRALRNAAVDRDVPASTNLHYFDNVCLRPGGLYKSCRNITCSINGTSFSTRPKMWASAVERLFVDGTEDVCYGGWQNDRYPYSGIGDDREQLNEPGRHKRCKDLSKRVYLEQAKYGVDAAADATTAQDLRSYTYKFVLRTKLPLGPFIYQQFPHLAGFDSNKAPKSHAYIGNLSIQFDFEDNPLPYWFQFPSTCASNSLSCTNPFGYAHAAMADAALLQPDLHLMWQNTEVSQSLTDAGSVAIGVPYADYIFSSPGDIQLQSSYLLAGKQFVAYEDFQGLAVGDSKATFVFSNIKVQQVPQLCICFVEDADTTVGNYVGARQAKWKGRAANIMRKGGAWANLWSVIDYKSVRIQVSTRNSVLANLTGEALGIGEKSQYNVFRKYSQGRTKMSFAEWRDTSMALIFSAEELNLDVYGSAYEALSLSISFDAYKSVADRGLDFRQIGIQQVVAAHVKTAGINKRSATTPYMVARLVMMQATEISLQEGSCDKKMVYYPSGVAKAYVESQQAQKVSHGAPKSQLTGY